VTNIQLEDFNDTSHLGAPSENFVDETIEERRPFKDTNILDRNKSYFGSINSQLTRNKINNTKQNTMKALPQHQ
jgi:hypothetical protein